MLKLYYNVYNHTLWNLSLLPIIDVAQPICARLAVACPRPM